MQSDVYHERDHRSIFLYWGFVCLSFITLMLAVYNVIALHKVVAAAGSGQIIWTWGEIYDHMIPPLVLIVCCGLCYLVAKKIIQRQDHALL